MTLDERGDSAQPELAEVLFEIGQHGVTAEGVGEIAGFAVERVAALFAAPCAALLQIEGDRLLPIATHGWNGALRGVLKNDRVVVPAARAARAGVDRSSSHSAELTVRGHPWAILAVHGRPGVTGPQDGRFRLGAVASMLASVRERELMARQLGHLLNHDALTGLPNRKFLVDRLRELKCSAPDNQTLTAVICIDLDRFFQINSAVGHGTGDVLLADVAARLHRAAREGDTTARQIGDRFLVLCEGLGSEAAARAEAERLRRSVCGAVRVGGREVVMAASAGVALAGPDASPDDVLQEAEVALFEAKDTGASRVALYEPSFHDRLSIRRHLEIDLTKALDSDQFVLHYQPLVSLDHEGMVSAEGLIRWEHPVRGTIAPVDFIPVAEESDLVIPIGEWVLTTACVQAREWQDVASAAGVTAPGVSVNLSARQVNEAALVRRVSAALDHAHLPADCLTLEITETVVMSDTERSTSALRKLKELGVRLSIDDFGTGYSSLAYLKRFPVDVLKIDRCFVDGLGTNLDDSVIVGGILSLAKALGLATVAEGVETRIQADELARLGCSVAQGFLFAKPEPHAALCARILNGPVGAVGVGERLRSLSPT